ncbi:cytoplasmic dynein intermediate chain, putative [Plasmodium ovale wallikeri]|uniref:Cytoplasmic dynein intermediate chain, putative n=2 Tax=Plasmodium ovale TaxID=36330 RepID=A0A1A8YNT9_PLAOA|nr:cytoplasmic dynein intermediate chain, putative [Plasmodium ovale wallikeri]SBT33201.1 cytoplasmic dynein intermediate chain, putative [Plasmodium ovale wallikeri]SBT76036.1 cytoplasmic dynein intermediate chain, putative [Plasmodium ovale]
MENLPTFDVLSPIDEEERIHLQNKLNEKRLELEEKKKYLEELRKVNEQWDEQSQLGNGKTQEDADDFPDPDQMLKNFLDTLQKEEEWGEEAEGEREKEEEEVEEIEEAVGEMKRVRQQEQRQMRQLRGAGISRKDQTCRAPSSIEERAEQTFLFKKKASANNFNFKVYKPNDEKVIHVQKKSIDSFDKSIQVNIFDDDNSVPFVKKKKGKITTFLLNKASHTEKNKLDDMIMSGKKNVILKVKEESPKKVPSREGESWEETSSEKGEDETGEGLPRDTFEQADQLNKGRKETSWKEKKKKNFLDEETKRRILKSNNFVKFIENSSKLIERSFGEQDMFNATFDFVVNDFSEESERSEKLKLVNSYYCKKYTGGRPITDVKTSNIYSELFLASYGLSETSNYTDPDGYVLVWNTTMNGRPEYVFTSQPAVCTALFSKFNPHLIIGGTYTGNVILWDIRASQKPVQKTYLTSQGHLHPIYCAEIIGTQNAHNLITADTDGRLCNWSLNMLTYPSDTVDLKRANKEVSCCCLSFQEGEINTLYGGADDGSLFQAQIHGNKVGITEFYNIHHGPLTATQFHPLIEGTNDHNDLILTSSVDWTCKLLSIKDPKNPLFTFDAFDDYLMDAKWNPVHPGIFATCSSNGNIKLWNLSYDIECSYFETSVQAKSTNKIAWSYEGKKLIAADSDGTLTLWNTSSEIYQPRPEDITKFDSKIAKMKSEIVTLDQADDEAV